MGGTERKRQGEREHVFAETGHTASLIISKKYYFKLLNQLVNIGINYKNASEVIMWKNYEKKTM